MIESSLRSSPSSRAAAIEETVHEKDVAGCQMLGEVAGSSMLGDVGGDGGSTSLNNALVEAKEQAAGLGASHLLIVGLKKAADITFEDTVANLVADIRPQLGGSAIDARAYKCN